MNAACVRALIFVYMVVGAGVVASPKPHPVLGPGGVRKQVSEVTHERFFRISQETRAPFPRTRLSK